MSLASISVVRLKNTRNWIKKYARGRRTRQYRAPQRPRPTSRTRASSGLTVVPKPPAREGWTMYPSPESKAREVVNQIGGAATLPNEGRSDAPKGAGHRG